MYNSSSPQRIGSLDGTALHLYRKPSFFGEFIRCAIVFFIRNELVRGGPAIATQDLVSLVNQEEAVVLDVRPKEEFSEGHIVGAINIPYDKLDDRYPELNRYKEKAMVVVCKMGSHSGAAGLLLKSVALKR